MTRCRWRSRLIQIAHAPEHSATLGDMSDDEAPNRLNAEVLKDVMERLARIGFVVIPLDDKVVNEAGGSLEPAKDSVV